LSGKNFLEGYFAFQQRNRTVFGGGIDCENFQRV